MQSFMESQQFKITLNHNSQKVWSGSKTMDAIFHRLHMTEDIVCVPKMYVWKNYPKAVVPNLFVTADW